MKKIFFIILAVVVVILVFSLGTFGVEADAVLNGYENTRRYAQDSKMLTVAVDTYKAEVEKKVEDEKKLEETEPIGFSDLPAYGTIGDHSKYEDYTDGLTISNDPKLYLTSAMYEEKYDGDIYPTDDEKSAAARFDSILHHLTKNDGVCDGTTETEYRLYWARQCAALGAWYINQVSYKDYLDISNWKFFVGETNVQCATYLVGMNTCWSTTTKINYYQNEDELKKFFTNVTPGTLVKSGSLVINDKPVYGHSYIILGADEERVIIYDCNQDAQCSIKLSDWTWGELSTHPAFVGAIELVIAPPNTMLPYGCTRNFGQVGTIL